MKLTRLKLAKIIRSRLGNTLSSKKIYQAVGIIIAQIIDDLVNDHVVSVCKFGTLSPHVRIKHMANNVTDGVVRELPASRAVKFHPHESFTRLILDRRERFLKNKSNKS
jgi:nucleoid DNA-binding protein